jgi:PmbA protein
VEVNGFTSRRFLEQLDMAAILRRESEYLIDLQSAKAPPTGKFPVVLGEDALDTLFDFFTSQADASALYFNFSNFKQGESVLAQGKTPLEKINISTNPSIKGCKGAGFFDELGFPLAKLDLIKDGNLNDFTINGKFSSLLNMPRTTQLSTVEVAPGSTSYSDFLSDGVIELLKFSTFIPNGITGSFSGEIRLGYLHKNGKKIPIRGGSVSGNTQEAFVNARFSKETVKRENYSGPRGIFFQELTLAGE